MTMVDSFEKIPVKIYPDLKAGSKAVAKQIADFQLLTFCVTMGKN